MKNKKVNLCEECHEKYCLCDEVLDEEFDTLTDLEYSDIVKQIKGV
jgi:hypothetical protein